MKHVSKKLKLSPMQREIVWMLEEAGSEALTTVLITLHGQFPGMAWRELMKNAEDAVKGLLHLGLVSLRQHVEKERGGYIYMPLEPNEVARVLSFQQNYARRNQVRDWPNDGSWVELVITGAGERALYE